MNFFKCKRLFVLAMICALFLNCCAAVAEQAYITSKSTVYASADKSSGKLGTLSVGTSVELVATKGNWAKIELNGKTGYTKASSVSTVVNQNNATGYTVKAAPMYKKPNTSSTKLGTIPAGETVTVIATAGNIAYIKYSGKNGYVATSTLTATKPADDAMNVTAYASVDNATVYNAKGKVITHVALNTEVTVVGVKNDICKVVRGGKTAYMKKSTLSTEKTVLPEPTATAAPDDGVTEVSPTTVYVKNDGAKVYNSKGKALGSLKQNTALTMTAYNDKLAKVSNGSNTGFMHKSDLSAEKIVLPEPTATAAPDDGIINVSDTTVYVKKNGAKVYNAKGKAIGTLKQNTALTMTAYNDKLAKVTKGSNTGFMYKADLSTEKIDNGVTEVSPTTVYVKNDGAKVYNAKGKALGSLKQNTALTMTAYTDKLAKVSSGSNTGFMYKSDLSDEKVEQKDDVVVISPTTFYVKTDDAKVVDASGSTLATLSVNTAVTVVAYNDDLAKVVKDNTEGFMLKSALSPEKVATATIQYGDKGDTVKQIQSRLKELGYFFGTVAGNYLDLTKSAVTAFQKAAKLTANGIVDEETYKLMFSDKAPKAPTPSKPDVPTPGDYANGSSTKPATGTAIAMDWWTSGIQSIFARGTTATVTDVSTGIAWRETRSGGTNHADVQPTTAADTAAMKKACGGWSWNRRAVFVTINGVNYAASINCMPHGSGSISNNNFDGHHCIHFTNSRTHGSNKVCSLHQAAIKKAAGATL